MPSPFQDLRDNIGIGDENQEQVLIPPFRENVYLEEGPTATKVRDINDAFVLGVATNAILGTTLYGENNIGSQIVTRVVNPANIFHEHYRFNHFDDSTNSTATFNTTNFLVNFAEGEVHLTLSFFLNVQSISNVIINVTLIGGKQDFIVDDQGGKHLTITEGS